MRSEIDRRRFLSRIASAGLGLAAAPSILAGEPAGKFSVGVMGLGRGMGHVEALLDVPGAEISYLCDVDARRMESAAKAIEAKGRKRPQGVKDFRKILDDKSVDGLSIAAPNFWHAPATILACAAGKHVYVEKPGSHNAREGELMVAAARKHDRKVQMGNQRRSQPGIIEAMEKVRGGAIGRVLYARTWYTGNRPSIGKGKEVPVPEWLDYDLWEGPVPHRPYRDNLVHYNWHWMWHWGGGELANNGVHYLDLVRWGLGVDFPSRVSLVGGRYRFEDDQETPDTACAVYDFGGKGASFDWSSCHPRKNEKLPLIAFYGEGGTVTIEDSGYKVLDLGGKEIGKGSGPWKDSFHFANWIDAVRSGGKLNSEIGEAQKSTLLCHLGNIACRTGRTLACDPATGRPAGADEAATKLWGREYRPGWEPKV
jgi:predicted dehydrogenase